MFDEEKQDILLNLVARLHVNWRDVLQFGWYALTRHERDVVKQLEGDANIIEILRLHPELAGWDKDVRVLLNYKRVERLLDLLPQDKPEIKTYVLGYADYLKSFSASKATILREMESLQDQFRFRLLVLKNLRNHIVHQALTSMTNVSLYTDELEEIFEEAVVKLSNDAIRQIPACSSIRDLIEKYEEMWIS